MKIEIEGLTKTYGRMDALSNLNLVVEDGIGRLVMIGPSGGGKSTLLRILGGLEVPTAGRVMIDGSELQFDDDALLRHRRRNGFVFQAFNLFPHLTALRNIALPLEKVHGKEPAEAEEMARACLERFDLAGHAEKRPGQLSGGQQQRVGLARAIAIKPRLLLLDEPTSALDPEMTAEVLDVIGELAEGGQDIVLSTHEMGFARAVADQVVFLAAGQIVEDGTPEELFERPRDKRLASFLSRVMRY